MRSLITRNCWALLALEAVSVFSLGSSASGALVSDVIQAILGIIVLTTGVSIARQAKGLRRNVWIAAAAAFFLLFCGQMLSVIQDTILLGTGRSGGDIPWAASILFSLWFLPLSLLLFLGPRAQAQQSDPMFWVDIIQAVVLMVASYFVLFYVPHLSDPGGTELPRSSLAGYFYLQACLTIAFFIRGLFGSDRALRRTWILFGTFLCASAVVDAAYYYTPARNLRSGSWYDLLWSGVLLIPIYAARDFEPAESACNDERPAHSLHSLSTQLVPLLYPVLILIIATQVSEQWVKSGLIIIGFSYCCTSLRLLVGYDRLVALKDALDYQASHDQLTCAWNRRAIENILRAQLSRAERNDSMVGAIVIDADHFKQVNDRRGHDAGDAVLQRLVQLITKAVRSYDYVGRYGGDEFVVIAPDCSREGLSELAERIRSRVANDALSIGTDHLSVTVSVGASTGHGRQQWEALILQADKALFEAKKIGRNQIAVYSDPVSPTNENCLIQDLSSVSPA